MKLPNENRMIHQHFKYSERIFSRRECDLHVYIHICDVNHLEWYSIFDCHTTRLIEFFKLNIKPYDDTHTHTHVYSHTRGTLNVQWNKNCIDGNIPSSILFSIKVVRWTLSRATFRKCTFITKKTQMKLDSVKFDSCILKI